MKRVNEILQQKGSTVWSVHPDDTVYDALALMADKNIGAVVVTVDDQLAGIFTERDYARKVVLQGHSSRTLPVGDIMSTEVICVRPDQSVEKCMALMTEKRIRHLPVLGGEGQLAGIISIGDVVNAIINRQQVMINHLEDYIMGMDWTAIRQSG